MSSFSENVKEELLRTVPERPCCMLSELSAITRHSGSLILRGRGRMALRFHAPTTALAKRILVLLKRRLKIVPQIVFHEEHHFGRRRSVFLDLPEADTRRLLTALQMLKTGEGGLMLQRMPRNTMSKRCCQRAYMRAVFLSCGSVRDPSGGYTMEFAFSDPEKAQAFQSVLERQHVAYHLRKRRQDLLVTLTDGETVADVLAMMGAPLSRLSFEDQRIVRGGSARATRALNCDTANLNRQLQSAEEQILKIRAFEAAHSLSALPDSLAEAARLRLEHPSASLEELGTYFTKQLTKSGVSHRMERLMNAISE